MEPASTLTPEQLSKLLTKIQQWYQDWEEATDEARTNEQRDRDYCDGIQWTDEELAELERRGQPALVFNHIGPKVDFLLGDEIQKRVDPKCMPVTPAHEDGAASATDALRYLDKSQGIDHIGSCVYDNLTVEGYSGGSWEVRRAVGPDGAKLDEVELVAMHVPWEQIWFDPHSRKRDFSDARYIGTHVWMDLEDAQAFYPDVDPEIWDQTERKSGNYSATESTEDKPSRWMSQDRKRLAVFQCFYKQPGPNGNWYTAHFVGGGFTVAPKPTDFREPKFGRTVCPLVLVRHRVNRENEAYGAVRRMIGPQDEINKRRSKAIHRLSTKQVVAVEGAVKNPEEARIEVNRPDGWVTLNPEFQAGFQIQPSEGLTATEFQFLQESKSEIDNVGPSLNVMAGLDTSGRAQLVHQKAASVPLEPAIDNLRDWRKRFFTVGWFGVRQYWTYPMWLRVSDDTDERKGYRFVGLNQPMTRAARLQQLLQKGVPPMPALGMLGDPALPKVFGQVVQALASQGAPPPVAEQQALQQLMVIPPMQEKITTNQIDQIDMDIALDEAPETLTLIQEQFDGLIKLAMNGMQIPPELIIEASSLPNKKRLLEMLRRPQTPDPQQQQVQAEAQQIAKASAVANLQKVQADAHRSEATAKKTEAEIGLVPGEAQAKQAAAAVDVAKAREMSRPELLIAMPAREGSGGGRYGGGTAGA